MGQTRCELQSPLQLQLSASPGDWVFCLQLLPTPLTAPTPTPRSALSWVKLAEGRREREWRAHPGDRRPDSRLGQASQPVFSSFLEVWTNSPTSSL